jgi:hypothetical protein
MAVASGGGGGFLAILLLPIIFALFFFYAALYPISGTITFMVGYAIQHWMFAGDDLNALMRLIVSALPCLVALMFSYRLEKRAAEHAIYRRIRHWIRVVGFGLLANEFISPFAIGRQARLGLGVLKGPTFGQFLIMAAAMVCTHLVLRWLERYDGDWRGALCHARHRLLGGRSQRATGK